MGASVSRKDFTYSYTDEPHATRRKLILQKYPHIKKLMGVDPAFKWQVVALVIAQFISFYLLRNVKDFWILFILAYFIGGVANHALMLAIHEISHNMAYGTARPLANRIFGMFANLPLGIPLSISFRRYHLDHHRYQGDEILDVDIPTFFEASLFTSPLRKTIWCILQPFFYFLRPLFIHPKPVNIFEVINTLVQLACDTLIVYLFGWHVLAYTIGGAILGTGLHPVAGHFISEHTLMFEHSAKGSKELEIDSVEKVDKNNVNYNDDCENKFTRDKISNNDSCKGESFVNTIKGDGSFLIPETCSYYGILNWLTFNVGYHVEHHDFPSIPGSRLYKLKEIAPEFYANLNYHSSWTYVLWKYIMDPNISPAARVRRPHKERI